MSGWSERSGPQHPDTLRAMIKLSHTHYALDDFLASKVLLEEAEKGLRGTLGPGHPDTLRALAQLGHTLLAIGDLEGARAVDEELKKRQTSSEP